MNDLPSDVFESILDYLTNDSSAIGRLSLCSSSLHQRIAQSKAIWEKMYLFRWTSRSEITSNEIEDDFYRLEFKRRRLLDMRASELLFCMSNDLQITMKLQDDNENNKADGDPIIGHAWSHPSWTEFLLYRSEITDILRFHANKNLPTASSTVADRLVGFLACRCLQNIQFAECLFDWKRLTFHDSQQMGDYNLILMEQYSVLMCHLQQTPEEQLNVSKDRIGQSITSQMDSIAEECGKRIREEEEQRNQTSSPMSGVEKLLLVKDILVNEYKFTGNRENYYDYRNSLLNHVLETRKGIPITLCIVFACICRRLGLHTFVVGLPGHIVLGFQDNTHMDDSGFYVPGETIYLDVFNSGKVMSALDCKRKVFMYQVLWNDKYLLPLTAAQVLDRTFNNLSNCHLQAMGVDSTPPFRSDLFFQQRALASIHRQPKSIAEPIVERLTKDLPLTISPDLLRYYGLLSVRNI